MVTTTLVSYCRGEIRLERGTADPQWLAMFRAWLEARPAGAEQARITGRIGAVYYFIGLGAVYAPDLIENMREAFVTGFIVEETADDPRDVVAKRLAELQRQWTSFLDEHGFGFRRSVSE
jgi:hypothetical protein